VPDSEVNGNMINRLRYHIAYSNMFYGEPSLARLEFTTLIDEAPGRPEWLVPLSLVNLGRLHAITVDSIKAVEDFYNGELLYLDGDIYGASRHYINVLNRKVPDHAKPYRMLAAVRMAEIAGRQKNYTDAHKFLDRALQNYHDKNMLQQFLLEGRRRYYERLDKGEPITNTLTSTDQPSKERG